MLFELLWLATHLIFKEYIYSLLEEGQLINLNHQLINFFFGDILKWVPRNVAYDPTLLFKRPKGSIFFRRQQP